MPKVMKSLAVCVMVTIGTTGAGVSQAGTEKNEASPKPSKMTTDYSGKGNTALKRLKRLDADKNGAISKAEYLTPRSAEFKALDSNHDNAVDPAEIGTSLLEPAQFRTKRFVKRIDANHDGKISREEFEQGPRAHFAGRDLNSDGKIDAQDRPPSSGGGYGWFGGEHSKKMGLGGGGRGNRPDVTLDTVVAKTQAEFNKMDGNADGTLDQSELAQQSAERIEFSKKRLMHWSDQNNDGKLSEEEFSARTLKRFSNLDLNDDGQIDGNDFPASERKGWFSR